MVWHPSKYAELLARRIAEHGTHVWLVNTGWTGGSYGQGRRMSLANTRAVIDAIHSRELAEVETTTDDSFGFFVPTFCPGVPSGLLSPRGTWENPQAYDATALKLAGLFHSNFEQFRDGCAPEICEAGPLIGR